MKFLVLSDIHGNLENLDKLDEQFKSVDGVLFGGDFAKFGEPDTGKPVLDKLVTKHEVIFSVIGNCDDPDFLEKIEDADISVENSLVFHDGLVLGGAGGGTKFSGDTLFEREEDEILSDFGILDSASENYVDENGKWNNLVLIMHNPPKDTECDKIPNGIHVGSQKLREYIEKYEPVLVVTGHIHESCGNSKIGETTVINPGSLAEGKYAIVELKEENDKWSVAHLEMCNL